MLRELFSAARQAAKWWPGVAWMVFFALVGFHLLGYTLEWWEKVLFAAYLITIFFGGYLTGGVDGYKEADEEWETSLQSSNYELHGRLGELAELRKRAENEVQYASLLASIRSGAWRN